MTFPAVPRDIVTELYINNPRRFDYDTVVIADTPVAYWPMDDTNSTMAAAVGALTGTYTASPTATTMPNGDGAQVFNGSTQYATVGDNAILSAATTNELTLEAWIRPDVLEFPNDQGDGYVNVIGKASAANLEYDLRMYSFTTGGATPNRIWNHTFQLDGAATASSFFQDTVTPGQWIHVALVINKASTVEFAGGHVRIYKNGVLRDTDDLSAVTLGNGTAVLRIGTRDLNSFFQGAIGKVAVYNYEVTPGQLAHHYNVMTGNTPGWVDISPDVRGDTDGITITHGRPNEAGDPQPSSCGFVLDNPDGHYSPDWPESDYYGSLDRNTPTRTTINLMRDTFTRTVANEWDTSDTGHTYELFGTGGTVSVNDLDVAGGVGTVSIPTAGGERYIQVTSLGELYDVDVAATVTMPFTDVTGASIAPLSIVLRDIGGTDSVWAQILINTTQQIYLRIWDGVSDFAIGPEVFITELRHTAGQALRCRAQAEGNMFRAKVWPAGSPEPYEWRVTGFSSGHPTAGHVAIFGWVLTGNTNAKPIVLSYDDIIVRSLVHAGEVSSWPANWDTSGNDVTATVESFGISRRLGQGAAPVQSTLYRGISALPGLLGYWPGEDGPDSSTLSSAIGGFPMLVTGATTFATYSEFAATLPIPTFGTGGVWKAAIPWHPDPTKLQLQFLMHIPDGGLTPAFPTGAVICDIATTSGYHWSVWYHTGGALSSHLTRYDTTTVYDSGPVAFDVDGRNLLVSLDVEQNGANVDLTLLTLEVGADGGAFITDSIPNRPVLPVQWVVFGNNGDCSGMSIGQIHLNTTVIGLFDLTTELNAYQGELAEDRLIRLCDQNNVSLSFILHPEILTVSMGPQRPLTLFQLLKECTDADRGTLYDSRGELGLTYRQLASIYNQADRFSVDYSAGQIGEPFKPVRDDQATRNDITVSRTNGGYSRLTLDEGRLSVQEPPDGGVGRYDTSLTLNVDTDGLLDNIAGFELRKGTVAKTRYPSVTVNLHNHNVATDADLAINTLDLGVDDRFSITNPKPGQTADTISLIARGWSRYLSNFIDTLTINAAPAEPYDVVRLDGDTTYPSKWDTGGSELTAGTTPTATTLLVTVTGTQLWTTDAAHMPIPILVGGEEMSVTAISGSSPQTFTVTRSVNGIGKAHAAGTTLTLRTRPVFGL